MVIAYISLFLGTVILALIVFFLVTIAVGLFLRLMEFYHPKAPDLARIYSPRYLGASVLAGLTAVVFFAWLGAGPVDAWTSSLLAVLLWSIGLIFWELKSTHAAE